MAITTDTYTRISLSYYERLVETRYKKTFERLSFYLDKLVQKQIKKFIPAEKLELDRYSIIIRPTIELRQRIK